MPAVTLLQATALAAHGLAAALAIALCRRWPAQRPIAAFLVAIFGVDLIRLAIRTWVLVPARTALGPGTPYSGWPRVAFHTEQAAFLVWPLGVAALACIVFLRRSTRIPFAAYGLTVVAVIAAYPALRHEALGWVYALLHGITALFALACAPVWKRKRPTATPDQVSLLLIAALDLVLFVGPFWPLAFEPFGRWPFAQFVYAGLFFLLALLQGASLWAGFLLPTSQQLPSDGDR